MNSKAVALFLSVSLATTLGACSSGEQSGDTEQIKQPTQEQPASEHKEHTAPTHKGEGGEGGEG